jgi:hypothetical protein
MRNAIRPGLIVLLALGVVTGAYADNADDLPGYS